MQEPTRTTMDAVVRLLADDDPVVFEACRSRLLSWGESCRVVLESVSERDSARARVAARRILQALDLRAWALEVGELGQRVAFGGRNSELLAEGVSLIHALGSPHRRSLSLELSLDELVEGARETVRDRSSVTAARHFANYMGEFEGFSGCTKSYYRAENLFLDRVIERRRGLPIALVTLYLLVGRRAGLELSAVRLPDDYYLVRAYGRRNTLIDPFHGGRLVTKADCARFLRSVGATKAVSSQLRSVDDVHVLLGMMSTLGRVYDHREDRDFRDALQRAQRSLSLL